MKLDSKILYSSKIWFIVALIVGIFLFAKSCYYKDKSLTLEKEKEIYVLKQRMAIQEKDSIINAKGKTITRQTALITQNQSVINQISSEVFDLKKKDEKNLNTISLLRFVTATRIDSQHLTFYDTIPVNVKNKDSVALVKYILDSTITVPRKDSAISKYFTINQTITKKGVTLDSLVIFDTLNVRITEKDNGLFKKNTIEVQNFHTNPYITSTHQESLIYKPKGTGLIPYLIAFVAGVIGTLLVK